MVLAHNFHSENTDQTLLNVRLLATLLPKLRNNPEFPNMPRKADHYVTWLHRWIDIILFAVVLAIVAILLTDSYAATAKDFSRSRIEAASNYPCG